MVWGLLFLSAATIGVSTILGIPPPAPAGTTSTGSNAGRGGGAVSRSSWMFLAGANRLALTDSHRIFLSGAGKVHVAITP
jgi:hypothetical protein